MQALLTTSFDRYARYSYVAALRDAWFPERTIRVLDVGDPYGTLAPVLPADATVSLDLFADGAPTAGGHDHVIGSGFSLPFADATFDLVASHDVFEHLPVEGRAAFVEELLRVAAGPVVLVAPFADPRTARCEQIVNAYYVARTGGTLEPLDEHADGGLPDLDWLTSWLRERDVDHRVHSDGWLHHWLAMMLLKAHCVAEGLPDLDRALDTAFNTRLRGRDRRAPHYRRALVLRPPPGTEPDLPGPPPPPGDVEHDVSALTTIGWELAGALTGGSDPTLPGSRVRAWVDARVGDDGEVGELARSLQTVLDGAAELLTVEIGGAPSAGPVAVTVAVVVLDNGTAEDLERARAALAAQDYPSDLVSVVVAGREVDDVTALNTAVADVDAECIAVLDSRVRVEASWLASLVGAYDPSRGGLVVGSPAPGEAPGEALAPHRAAMLVERNLYRNTGGFDGSFLGVLDDVDFGWRTWVLGNRVLLAGEPVALPDVVVADEALPSRNALIALLKNAEDRTLRAVLGPEVLTVAGAVAPEQAGRALAAVLDAAPSALASRAGVQALRRRSDADLFARFGRPLTAVPAGWREVDARAALLGAFGGDTESGPRPPRLLVLDDGGRLPTLAALACGPGRLVVARAAPSSETPVWRDEAEACALAAESEVVLVDAALLARLPALLATPAILAVDVARVDPLSPLPAGVLERADLLLCGSEAQRDRWLAALADAGRIPPSLRAADPSLRSLVDVVPDLPAPVSGRTPEPDLVVAAGPADVVDLGTTVAAFAAASRRVPAARLVVLTDGHAAGAVLERAAAHGVADTCTVLDLADPAGETFAALAARAAVNLQLSRDRADARMAATSPVLDALAAGVPVVCTEGDPSAADVRVGAGAVVPAGDVGAASDALARLLADPVARARAVDAASEAVRRRRDLVRTGVLARLASTPWAFRHADAVAPRPLPDGVAAMLAARDDALRRQADELAALHRRIDELDAYIATVQRRLALLKRTPAYPAFKAARRLRRMVGGDS